MNSQELKEYFQTELENYSLERQKMEAYLNPDLFQKFPRIAVMEMFKILFKDVLSELPGITDLAISIYKKDLNFKLGNKERKQYFRKEIKKLERTYKKSVFAHWFTIDEFHKEIFTEISLNRILSSTLEEMVNTGIIKENGEIDLEKKSETKKINSELRYSFHTIIKAKILKIEFENLEKQSRFKTVQNLEQSNVQNPIGENNKVNDFTISTIEDYLDPIKDKFPDTSYSLLVEELNSYFTHGIFTNSNETISTINKINKKALGWRLNELYRAFKQDNLPLEYIKFGKERISAFKDVKFEETDYLKSNLYKYYTTKPQ